uniref:Uncharacterized protein n=1 Tax=Anguilla anguilla TaxID=7936 RepID=A0A0E9X3X4_ANGAN
MTVIILHQIIAPPIDSGACEALLSQPWQQSICSADETTEGAETRPSSISKPTKQL